MARVKYFLKLSILFSLGSEVLLYSGFMKQSSKKLHLLPLGVVGLFLLSLCVVTIAKADESEAVFLKAQARLEAPAELYRIKNDDRASYSRSRSRLQDDDDDDDDDDYVRVSVDNRARIAMSVARSVGRPVDAYPLSDDVFSVTVIRSDGARVEVIVNVASRRIVRVN